MLTLTIQTSANSPFLAMHRKVWEANDRGTEYNLAKTFYISDSKIFDTTVACKSENAQFLCQHFYFSSYQSDIYFKYWYFKCLQILDVEKFLQPYIHLPVQVVCEITLIFWHTFLISLGKQKYNPWSSMTPLHQFV